MFCGFSLFIQYVYFMIIYILLIAGMAYPLFIIYQREGLSELTPRVIIVGFLTCVQAVFVYVGSFLVAAVPWFFAMKVALNKDDELGPGNSSGSGNSSDSDQINNLF